jgi:hypothetical protein
MRKSLAFTTAEEMIGGGSEGRMILRQFEEGLECDFRTVSFRISHNSLLELSTEQDES